jgi:glutathione peroxidase
MTRTLLAGLTLAVFAATTAHAEPKGPLDFEAKTIDGETVKLSRYAGKVVLVVNVASRCGLTPQYEGLQALHAKYAKAGLAIVAFPANDFLRQEPGTNAEIKGFCKTRYGVGFDLFAKIKVKGDGIAPLYGFLTSKQTNPRFAGPIRWNFDKFLIGRDGQIIGRFSPRTKPRASELVKELRAALASKP